MFKTTAVPIAAASRSKEDSQFAILSCVYDKMSADKLALACTTTYKPILKWALSHEDPTKQQRALAILLTCVPLINRTEGVQASNQIHLHFSNSPGYTSVLTDGFATVLPHSQKKNVLLQLLWLQIYVHAKQHASMPEALQARIADVCTQTISETPSPFSNQEFHDIHRSVHILTRLSTPLSPDFREKILVGIFTEVLREVEPSSVKKLSLDILTLTQIYSKHFPDQVMAPIFFQGLSTGTPELRRYSADHLVIFLIAQGDNFIGISPILRYLQSTPQSVAELHRLITSDKPEDRSNGLNIFSLVSLYHESKFLFEPSALKGVPSLTANLLKVCSSTQEDPDNRTLAALTLKNVNTVHKMQLIPKDSLMKEAFDVIRTHIRTKSEGPLSFFALYILRLASTSPDGMKKLEATFPPAHAKLLVDFIVTLDYGRVLCDSFNLLHQITTHPTVTPARWNLSQNSDLLNCLAHSFSDSLIEESSLILLNAIVASPEFRVLPTFKYDRLLTKCLNSVQESEGEYTTKAANALRILKHFTGTEDTEAVHLKSLHTIYPCLLRIIEAPTGGYPHLLDAVATLAHLVATIPPNPYPSVMPKLISTLFSSQDFRLGTCGATMTHNLLRQSLQNPRIEDLIAEVVPCYLSFLREHLQNPSSLFHDKAIKLTQYAFLNPMFLKHCPQTSDNSMAELAHSFVTAFSSEVTPDRCLLFCKLCVETLPRQIPPTVSPGVAFSGHLAREFFPFLCQIISESKNDDHVSSAAFLLQKLLGTILPSNPSLVGHTLSILMAHPNPFLASHGYNGFQCVWSQGPFREVAGTILKASLPGFLHLISQILSRQNDEVKLALQTSVRLFKSPLFQSFNWAGLDFHLQEPFILAVARAASENPELVDLAFVDKSLQYMIPPHFPMLREFVRLLPNDLEESPLV